MAEDPWVISRCDPWTNAVFPVDGPTVGEPWGGDRRKEGFQEVEEMPVVRVRGILHGEAMACDADLGEGSIWREPRASHPWNKRKQQVELQRMADRLRQALAGGADDGGAVLSEHHGG